MSSTSTSEITQGDIDKLLAQMQQLRQEITTARENIAPLEANLAETYNEFQTVVGTLRRHSLRLQAEVASLRSQIQRFSQEEEEISQVEEEDEFSDRAPQNIIESNPQDPEAVAKDMLLEHIFRVLEPDINDVDAELVGNLQGICSDRNASLADVLEQLPWGCLVWTTRSSQETNKDQYHRLNIWQQALKRQLENLHRSTERLQKDQRYTLWQQRQKGAENWHNFLDRCVEQQQDQNYELEAELGRLREDWQRITNSSNL